MDERVRVTVTIADRDRFESVAEEIVGQGLQIVRKLPILGVVVGDVPKSRIGLLESLPGVASVEPEKVVKIA